MSWKIIKGLKYVEMSLKWTRFPISPSIFVGELLAKSFHIVPLCRGSLCSQGSVTKGHHAWLARPGDVSLCISSINHHSYLSVWRYITSNQQKTLAKASKSKFCQDNEVYNDANGAKFRTLFTGCQNHSTKAGLPCLHSKQLLRCHM